MHSYTCCVYLKLDMVCALSPDTQRKALAYVDMLPYG
jgi:hypothetical protein